MAVDKSECEPLGDGVVDLFVNLEFDRGEVGEGSDDLKNDMRDLEDLSGDRDVVAESLRLWWWRSRDLVCE